MSGPFISIIISDRLIIEGIALARIADKLEQMKSIAVVLVKPEESLHNIFGAARNFRNKVYIIDVQNFRNFYECIFFGNPIAGFILGYTNISIAFFIS